MSDDPHRIDRLETLHEMLGEPSPIASGKVWPTLEPSAQAFIARSPFALLATADAAGNVDVILRAVRELFALRRKLRGTFAVPRAERTSGAPVAELR